MLQSSVVGQCREEPYVVDTDLAKIERAFLEAQAIHAEALAQEEAIQQRINQANDRQAAISQARINGSASPAEASEYAALAGDIALLQRMLGEAKQQTADMAGAVRQAANRYHDGEVVLKQKQAHANYEALHARCQEIEKVFVACIGATARAGKAIGHSTLHQSFHISDPLHRAINLNVAPSVEV